MTTRSSLLRRPLLSAGTAAILACAACCAVPLLAAAGVGGGAFTALSAYVAPGTELVVGGGVFALLLGVAGARHLARRARQRGSGHQ
jgi:hypothetical protein